MLIVLDICELRYRLFHTHPQNVSDYLTIMKPEVFLTIWICNRYRYFGFPVTTHQHIPFFDRNTLRGLNINMDDPVFRTDAHDIYVYEQAINVMGFLRQCHGDIEIEVIHGSLYLHIISQGKTLCRPATKRLTF